MVDRPRTNKQRPLYAYLTKSARSGPAGANTPPQPALRQTPDPHPQFVTVIIGTQHSSVCQSTVINLSITGI